MKFSFIIAGTIVPFLILISLVYLPSFWVSLCMVVDFYTPWVLFESPLYEKYHQFLVSTLHEREELPMPILSPNEASFSRIFEVSKGFTFPFIVRGLLANSSGVEMWKDKDWWVKNYAAESVLCGTLSDVVENCTIGYFFQRLNEGKPFYISGASNIFDKNPGLHDMIDSDQVKEIEPGKRTATQIFMGVPDMGSDIHCAIGINIFRQITGRKKWWFIPPSQTVYLKPSINVNGFSAHTLTLVGKGGVTPSPWLNKLERYTAILSPGDVLFNPPWFWHGILNLVETEDINASGLVIGAPTRYAGAKNGKKYAMPAAFKSNPLFTVVAVTTLFHQYGLQSLSPDFKINLQNDIANNRRFREKKELVMEEHPFDAAD
eukprot:gene14313-19197_t